MNRLDLRNEPFGRLRAIEPAGRSIQRGVLWRCLCDPALGGCGLEALVVAAALRSGGVQSCGCLLRENALRYRVRGDRRGRRDRQAAMRAAWRELTAECEEGSGES